MTEATTAGDGSMATKTTTATMTGSRRPRGGARQLFKHSLRQGAVSCLLAGALLGATYGALILSAIALPLPGNGAYDPAAAVGALPFLVGLGLVFGGLFGAPTGLLVGLVGGVAAGIAAWIARSAGLTPARLGRVAGASGAIGGGLAALPAFAWIFTTSPGTLNGFTRLLPLDAVFGVATPEFSAVDAVLFVGIPAVVAALCAGRAGERIGTWYAVASDGTAA